MTNEQRKAFEELISDVELEKVFIGTNFGSAKPRQIVSETLLKIVGDFSAGHTATVCCQELKLIGKNKLELRLTKKGRRYLYYSQQAALSTQAELLKACEWQPIETAPKDGTMILATPCFGTSKQPYLIWWAVGRRYNKWRFGNTPITAKPTHWMPLPKPPTTQGA